MTPPGFWLARTLRQEAPLLALSVSQASLLADLPGKRVALVGNARALATRDDGAAIDAADLVIRINRAPMPLAISHGTRTDWLALATALPEADRARLGSPRILWMSPKRKRLTHADAHSAGFYLHPLADVQRLAEGLGAPPTTGLMMIDLLARSDLAGLTLYGFDFFDSLSLSGSRGKDQVPHAFDGERAATRALIQRDSRIRMTE